MGIKFPTYYFRFVERDVEVHHGGGFFSTMKVKILQQLWAESGWHGNEPVDDETWRPLGEWRDVKMEME